MPRDLFKPFSGGIGAGLMLICSGIQAHADVTISSRATANMSCSSGTCEPTAAKAVLNVGDLQSDIAEFGNMTVQTTGNAVEAHNIVVEAAFASPGSTTLNLEATGTITVNAPVTIGSNGALSELQLVSETAGELGTISFGPNGSIAFGSVSDEFDINGGVFVLVNSLSGLASAVAANPEGFYALASSYDAKGDGTYDAAPITTTFTGYFEALGNTISHLKIYDTSQSFVGMFAQLGSSNGFGVVRNLRIANASVKGAADAEVGGVVGYLLTGATLSQSSFSGTVEGGDSSTVGGLVGVANGTIVSSSSSAGVTGGSEYAFIGGLAGESSGTVSNSHATGAVEGGELAFMGGLIGDSAGTISGSFASGAVTSNGGSSYAGGLVAANFAAVTNCYATGKVTDAGGGPDDVGGLIGFNDSSVSESYATGTVTGSQSDEIGGVVGYDDTTGGFSDTYWNLTTSGISDGAGNIANDPGITGLTTRQMRSGLPAGFKKSVWTEKTSVNRGFPYLIANSPLK